MAARAACGLKYGFYVNLGIALTNQQLAGLVQHALTFGALNRDEAHCRPVHLFCKL
jgi:hypothetical protein